MSDPSRLAGRNSKAPLWFQSFISIFSYGHLAVAAFIVISGFCLQYSLFGSGGGRIKSLGSFFWRRAKRILPAYYGCLALSLLVATYVTTQLKGMPFEMYLPVTRENMWAHALLVHNFSPGWMYKINGVLWSIAIEAQLYIVFPLIVASFFRIGRWWTFVLASCVAMVLLGSVPEAMKLYPWFLPLFVLGMAAAHLAHKPHRFMRSTFVPRLVGLAAFGGVIYGSIHDWNLPSTDALMGLCIACLCYTGTVGRPSPLVWALSLRPLFALGGFSYSLYLIHHPVQQILYWLKPPAIHGEVADFYYLSAMLPVILCAAWLFSLVFEKPFIRNKQREAEKKALVPVSLPLSTAANGEAATKSPKVGLRGRFVAASSSRRSAG